MKEFAATRLDEMLAALTELKKVSTIDPFNSRGLVSR